LYDITSQEILKYIVTSSSNNTGSNLSSSAEHILLSPDYDEDGLSAYLYTSNNHKNTSFQTSQRTSKFIHFSKAHHKKIISIERRAAELLGVPTDCIEPLQLVRYQQGEYFQPHHDLGTLYDDGTVELPPSSFLSPPRRLVTIFVYINDVPAGCGGATKFPLLSEQDALKSDLKDGGTLQIQPKRGMALLFCNIDRLGFPEPSTVHSGEPLISLSAYSKARKRSKVESIPRETSPINEDSKTIKYGINIWACER
jgi:prolyl 4-hydroxylase